MNTLNIILGYVFIALTILAVVASSVAATWEMLRRPRKSGRLVVDEETGRIVEVYEDE